MVPEVATVLPKWNLSWRAMNLALSTRYLGRRPFTSAQVLAVMKTIGIRRAVLSDAVPMPDAGDLARTLKPAGAQVVAVEARFTPEAEGESPPSLLAPSRDAVAAAMRVARRSAAIAKEVGAPLVVLHLGEHALEHRRERDAELRARLTTHGVDDEALRVARALEVDLSRRLEADLERACRNLFALAKAEPEIRFAVATPESFAGFPNHRALGLLLSELKSVRLGYWHDVGVAHLHERVRLAPPLGFSGDYASAIVGASIHDVAGTQMHLPPGSGELDFAAIRDALPSVAIAALEIDARFAVKEIALAVSLLA